MGCSPRPTPQLRRRPRASRRARAGAAITSFLLTFWILSANASETDEGWFGKPYWLPTESMIPTLRVGDHFTTRPSQFGERGPVRGEIVIFYDTRTDAKPQAFVKRVVGLPGDTVSFEGPVLFVNGVRATGQTPIERIATPLGDLDLFEERLGERIYRIADSPEDETRRSGPFTVETDHYFVAGDNRDFSSDSRAWGTVRRDDIVAPTGSIFWSWDLRRPLTPLPDPMTLVRNLGANTHWQRIGIETN